MIKFSIITCTYNSGEYLAENIKSVISQSFVNFEHIFIDAYSSDNTLSLIDEYRKKFPDRVKIFQCQPRGISNAMNEGIRLANGDYLIHLHSDDKFYDVDVLTDVSTFLEKNNFPDWIFGREMHFNSQGELGVYPKFKIYTLDSYSVFGKYFLGLVNYIRHQTVFIKPEVFEKYGFFREDLRCVMDVELWLRIKNRTRWIFFDRLIACYRHHPGAQSTGQANQKANRKESLSVYRSYLGPIKFFLFFLFNKLLFLKSKVKK